MSSGSTMEGSVMNESCGTGVGIYGWQKKCLYAVLLILSAIVLLNITLVLWIFKVLQLKLDGMEAMSTVVGGLELSGTTCVMDQLVTTGLITRDGQTVNVEGTGRLTLQATDRSAHVTSSLTLDSEGLVVNSPSFKVKDLRGKTYFSVDKDTAFLTAKSLTISGQGGSVLEASLQTSVVSADIRSDLVLESAVKGVQTVTAAGVSVESRAGDIRAASNRDFSLITVDGSIKLESSNIMMKSLRHSQNSHHPRKHHHHQEKIFQLCVCSGGEMFLAEADVSCEAAADLEICR